MSRRPTPNYDYYDYYYDEYYDADYYEDYYEVYIFNIIYLIQFLTENIKLKQFSKLQSRNNFQD